ncbi:hypothetical protein KI387_037513, partial [Taxus chinensis]
FFRFLQGGFCTMKSPLPLTPNCKPRSNSQYTQHQMSDLGVGVEYMIAAEGVRVSDRDTLEDGLKDTVILGASSRSSPSSWSMAEAPVTPLTCRESARNKAFSITPLTDVSCHSCSKSEFNGCCFDEWSEKVEGEEPLSGAETPEHSTFDPFAAGPQELILAPKKPCKTKDVFNDDNGGNDGDGDDGHVPFDRPISLKKVCKGKGSRASVVRILCFEEYLDMEGENHNLNPNGDNALSLAIKCQHGPHFPQMGEEAHLKHQHKISYAGSLQKLDQTKDSQVPPENVPSGSRSRVVRALDMDRGKHSALGEHCEKGLVGGDDKPLHSATEDTLLEETFVEAMCGSFLQAILSKQYEDANMNCTRGNNEENVLSSGFDQSTPPTPITYQAFSSAADVCPGAPMKARSKLNIRGTGLGSVCRKLEF